jgi:hypothetical protein
MSELHLTDEILMAFADGELDEPVAAAVARVMAQDHVVAKKIIDFQQSRRLTRSVFASTLSTDVPVELQAAISAQIQAFEAGSSEREKSKLPEAKSVRFRRSYGFTKVALAASLAAVGVAIGYFLGSHARLEGGEMARLEDPLIRQELSRLETGREVEMGIGRFRVVSTYRLADGSLCREFRLRSASSTANAVACRADEWTVTFALTEPAGGAEYMPSSGGDLMEIYLQHLGAGEPLDRESELKALATFIR